jgi:GTP cyclohydrolase I
MKSIERSEDIFTDLLRDIGEDRLREGLLETPQRAWEAWKFWTSGYNKDPREVLKCFKDGAENVDEMVVQLNVSFWSMCEHHLAPFWGLAHVGYIPNGKIVGLSKIARVIDIFARRLQTQERLTQQIADAFATSLEPLGVGVVLQARHSCMESRGIQKAGTVTVTSALRGAFKEKPEARAEFLSLVGQAVQGRVL